MRMKTLGKTMGKRLMMHFEAGTLTGLAETTCFSQELHSSITDTVSDRLLKRLFMFVPFDIVLLFYPARAFTRMMAFKKGRDVICRGHALFWSQSCAIHLCS